MPDPITDEAIEAAAGVMLRVYDSQYNASHLTWHDFADEAREVLTAAAPYIISRRETVTAWAIADAERERLRYLAEHWGTSALLDQLGVGEPQ